MKSRLRLLSSRKKTKSAKLILLFLFFLLYTAIDGVGQQAKPTLDELLDQLAARSEHFERSLPDFVATETVTQESYNNNGKLAEHNVAISLLAGRQLRTTQGNRVELSFKEI